MLKNPPKSKHHAAFARFARRYGYMVGQVYGSRHLQRRARSEFAQ